MRKTYGQDCPVARALDVVGDRWTLLIVRDLFAGNTRFNTLLTASPGLPPKLLSGRLKKLEREGLVRRAVYSQRPPRVEYLLTEKGRSLEPVMQALLRWGLDHCFADAPGARDRVMRRLSSMGGPRAVPEVP